MKKPARESPVLAAQIMSDVELDAAQQRISGLTPGTVRLSIGLEDLGDLVEDVTQALAAVEA